MLLHIAPAALNTVRAFLEQRVLEVLQNPCSETLILLQACRVGLERAAEAAAAGCNHFTLVQAISGGTCACGHGFDCHPLTLDGDEVDGGG
jgi:hypothetical protein